MAQMELNIVIAKEVNGLEMGVLSDGTAYLSGRGLATLCGVAPSAIIQQAQAWAEGKRDGRLAKLLLKEGFTKPLMYIPTKTLNAYPDDVCMLVLEYYAFDATNANVTALVNFRKLARASLKQVIYGATGYDPANQIPDHWRQYHDRMLLNTAPKGYFSVFREMSELVMAAAQAGLVVDAKTVPDISVGIAWGKHWTETDGDTRFWPRTAHPHIYPDYFPQAKKKDGPPDAWVYPLSALGEFREWMQDHYLPNVFPNYLAGKVKQGLLTPNVRDLILDAVEVPELAP